MSPSLSQTPISSTTVKSTLSKMSSSSPSYSTPELFFFSTLPSQVLGGFNLPPPSQLFTLHQTVVESHTHRTSSLATITRSTARLLIISLLIRSRYFTPYLDQLLSRGPPRDLSSHGNHPNISNQRADWPLTLSTVVSDPQP